MDDFQTKMEHFFSSFKTRTYKRGDIILHEDDTPNGAYLIKSGIVKLYSFSPDGDELIRLVLGPGDLFPIRWVISGEPIDYYLEPVTDVECSYTSREAFLQFIKTDIDACIELMEYTVKRMGTLYKRMEFFAFGDAYQKMACILVYLTQRFGVKNGEHIKIDIPITQSDLGALVGMARETANEELERLREQDIIDREGHCIVIKDLEKLEKVAPFFTAI